MIENIIGIFVKFILLANILLIGYLNDLSGIVQAPYTVSKCKSVKKEQERK